MATQSSSADWQAFVRRRTPNIGAAQAGMIAVFVLSLAIGIVFIVAFDRARAGNAPAFFGEMRYVFMALLGALLALLSVTAWLVWRTTRERNTFIRERAEFVAIQLRAFDNASDAYLTFEPNGRIELINSAAEQMFGCRMR